MPFHTSIVILENRTTEFAKGERQILICDFKTRANQQNEHRIRSIS